MNPVAYTVRATLADPAVADAWIAWLRDVHLTEVLAAGALDCEVLRGELDDGGVYCEVRYHFTDATAFARYEREEAPRLRDEAARRFAPEAIRYTRWVAPVVLRR